MKRILFFTLLGTMLVVPPVRDGESAPAGGCAPAPSAPEREPAQPDSTECAEEDHA